LAGFKKNKTAPVRQGKFGGLFSGFLAKVWHKKKPTNQC